MDFPSIYIIIHNWHCHSSVDLDLSNPIAPFWSTMGSFTLQNLFGKTIPSQPLNSLSQEKEKGNISHITFPVPFWENKRHASRKWAEIWIDFKCFRDSINFLIFCNLPIHETLPVISLWYNEVLSWLICRSKNCHYMPSCVLWGLRWPIRSPQGRLMFLHDNFVFIRINRYFSHAEFVACHFMKPPQVFCNFLALFLGTRA